MVYRAMWKLPTIIKTSWKVFTMTFCLECLVNHFFFITVYNTECTTQRYYSRLWNRWAKWPTARLCTRLHLLSIIWTSVYRQCTDIVTHYTCVSSFNVSNFFFTHRSYCYDVWVRTTMNFTLVYFVLCVFIARLNRFIRGFISLGIT